VIYPVSIVIPCYNEAHRLQPGATAAVQRMAQLLPAPFEVVWVNDGSTDETQSLLQALQAQFPRMVMQFIGYASNRGKGHAVRRGVLAARGEKILVMDADFAIDLGDMDGFLQDLERYDVVIGSKKRAETKTVQAQGPLRRFLGKSFTVCTSAVLGLRCTDITCGLKGFRREVAQAIFGQQRVDRWAYDAETLFLVRRCDYRLHERPVTWLHVEGSKVSPMMDTMHSAKDLLVIIMNYWTGRYRVARPARQPVSMEA
jgi:dolichyl-phosphate beta-glucosyltransferase